MRGKLLENNSDWTQDKLEAHALYHIEGFLSVHSRTLNELNLPGIISFFSKSNLTFSVIDRERFPISTFDDLNIKENRDKFKERFSEMNEVTVANFEQH